MTKFEEELYNKVKVTNIELTTEAEYKKSTLINHFKNWHSDEEFQRLLEQNAELTQENNIVNQIDSQLAKENEDLKSQLQQQALPVVPECVGELIEWAKENGLSLKQIFVYDRYSDFPDADEWLGTNKEDGKGNKEHQDIFALAFITGKYQVEKPQLFYLREKNTNYYLNKSKNNVLELVPNPYFDKDNQFTQQEIDSMQTGSYELVPVEDGE